MSYLIIWILKHWLLFISAIAGAVAFYLWSNWKLINIPKKICGVFVIILVCHMIEEYVYPAGFHYIFNLVMGGSVDPTVYPLNQLCCMVTNFIAVIIFVFALWKISDKLYTLLTIAIFPIGQIITHTIFGIKSFEIFSSYGQSIPYSPGMINSIFFMLPITIYCIVYILRNRKIYFKNIQITLLHIGITIFAIAFLIGGLILLPMNVLGNDLNAPYIFENQGYYERFLK